MFLENSHTHPPCSTLQVAGCTELKVQMKNYPKSLHYGSKDSSDSTLYEGKFFFFNIGARGMLAEEWSRIK